MLRAKFRIRDSTATMDFLLICGMFVLLVFLFKIPQLEAYGHASSRNVSSQNVMEIAVVSLECPDGQWRMGEKCVPCRPECPRYSYISKNCTKSTDSQCTKCILIVKYDGPVNKYGGGGTTKTWLPRNIEACDNENRRIEKSTIIGFIVFIAVLFSAPCAIIFCITKWCKCT